MIIKELPDWLLPSGQAFERLLAQDRLPHAILIHGPRGIGKRLLALWAAQRLLGADTGDLSAALAPGRVIDPETAPAIADLRLVQLEDDARDIKIEQIRETINFIRLTAHGHGAKVALVCPAEALNRNAQNSLLKTLEEPPARSAIILVADALARLEPTVISRCHRERIAMPPAAEAEAWLRSLAPDQDWAEALTVAGGAPVTAMAMHESGFTALAGEFDEDIRQLAGHRATPVEIARKWGRQDQELCLSWLYRRVCAEMRTSALKTGTDLLSMERSYGYLSEINELRRLQGGGLNAETQLANLLSRWYQGSGTGQ